MIRVFAVTLLGCFWAPLNGAVAPIPLGASQVEVSAILGDPSGWIATGNRTIFTYPEGRIWLEAGEVVRIEWKSPEARAAEEIAAAERGAQRHAEGLQVLVRQQNSVDFRLSTPSVKIAFWREFAARYPTVPIRTEVEATVAELRTEQAAVKRERPREAQAETTASSGPVVVAPQDSARRSGGGIVVRRWPMGWQTAPFGPIPRAEREAEANEPPPPNHSTDAAFARYMAAIEASQRAYYRRMGRF